FSVQYRCFEKGPKVHSCGVCPVYAHPNGTKPNTFTVNVLPPNEEECTQIRKLHYDFHDNVGTSGNSESIDRSGELEVESICREQINAPQQQRSSLFSHIIAKGGGLYAFLAPSDHASIQIQRRHIRLKVSLLASKVDSASSPELSTSDKIEPKHNVDNGHVTSSSTNNESH
ncbi:hypothetical protein CISIN_1g0397311mg, partial [Citrus sinensis]